MDRAKLHVIRPRRALRTVMAVLALIAFAAGSAASANEVRELATQYGVLWSPYQVWTIEAPETDDDPFDVLATATFVHEGGADRHATPMFYVGDGRWSFRFTGTRTGAWTFATTSEHEALDGWYGRVEVEADLGPRATGFLTAAGNRFAVPVDETGTLAARHYNVYIDANAKNSVSDYSVDPVERAAEIDAMLDAVEAHGFDALFVAVNNNWFAFGHDDHAGHDSEHPSSTTFEVLESLIVSAHARGRSVHVWAWGDEERGWTPIGVGGINGPADQRLQRTIAARLGPLPGWTMSYGFDLHEWVTPEQTRAWASNLHDLMGWPHLLMARESALDVDDPLLTFRFDGAPLDVFSVDERPRADFYGAAVAALEATDVPALFERRFVYTRDGVWDMDTTRRALWRFGLAGGVGAVWGPLWAGGDGYPAPEQLHTHGRFWRDRWSLDLQRVARQADDGPEVVMHDTSASRTIVYAESVDAVRLDLRHHSSPATAVAVDTRNAYAEIDIGSLEASDQTWNAPYASDWVVSVVSLP